MATATFSDNTSSNGMKDNWVAKVSYTTTPYAGYTMVEATLSLTAKYTWTATLSNGYSLTINGDSVSGSGASVVSNGTVTLLTHKVKVTHTTNKTITISASVNASNIYYNSGGYYIGTYNPSQSITLNPLPTACTAPTSFTISPSPFIASVTLSWSGAKAGTANAIASYYIEYCTSSNNSTWGSWTALTTVTSTSTSGSTTIDISSKVTNNYYVKFRIRTQGNAGSSYYSAYQTSSSVRRQSYTACTAPTTFTASPATFETSVTLTWSGAKAGTNNSITRYRIQYATSSNNSTWSTFSDLTTSTSTSCSVDLSKVTKGYYVKFQIRTEGSAGSSYYSSYKASSVIRRNPYSKCTAPTTFTVGSDNFDTTITISWSGASGGTNNTIQSYLIRYCTSSDNATWSSWSDLQAPSTTASSGSLTIDVSSRVQRGQYAKFAIQVKGSAGSSYYSDYVYSSSIRRDLYSQCVAPTTVTVISEVDTNNIQHNNVFNSNVTISWSGAISGDNNSINRYYIQYCTSSDNLNWSDWQGLQSSDLTPVGTSSTTIDISAKVDRGIYVKFQIRAEGQAGSNYYSAYKQSNVIKRNSLPNIPSAFSISFPTSLEYSIGDNIVVGWEKTIDNDNNLKYYQLQGRYTTEGVWGDWVNIDEHISSQETSYTILPDSTFYNQVDNNEQIQFSLRGYDIFGEVSSYATSDTVLRFDITGVTLGIDNRWVICQLYYCIDGEYVECDVYAGIDGRWIPCSETAEF